MLLLYYNPTTKNYYSKYYKRVLDGYEVGYTNQYGHTVVKILVIESGFLVDVKSVDEYRLNRYMSRRKKSLRKRVIRRIIDVLYKFEE